MNNILSTALVTFVAASLGYSTAAKAEVLALVGCKIYASSVATPVVDAVVVVSDGIISAVGARNAVQVPNGARVIECSGKSVVAGFWNSHVHFTGPAWANAANASAVELQAKMQEMLTRWGFTSVWDLGSDPRNSLALRRRVEAGELAGPRILLTGNIFPKGGHPVYLPAQLQLPEAATPEEAAQMARTDLQMGLDGMKLFTGAFMGPGRPVVNMDTAVAMAAVDVTHAAGKPVFAHPQNGRGVDVVLESGVNVLAHTVPTEAGYTIEQLARFKSQGTALIPTLSLWTTVTPDAAIVAGLMEKGIAQLKTFSANGGAVLFGTDVGFTSLYDTTAEFEQMQRAITAREVLASLTTNPAQYFGATKKGRVEVGLDGDLVVLDADPSMDARNLAKVAYTIRGGKIIYQRP
jgi:imidazolonepropionase-like amidohydrolase